MSYFTSLFYSKPAQAPATAPWFGKSAVEAPAAKAVKTVAVVGKTAVQKGRFSKAYAVVAEKTATVYKATRLNVVCDPVIAGAVKAKSYVSPYMTKKTAIVTAVLAAVGSAAMASVSYMTAQLPAQSSLNYWTFGQIG